jgi:hypothetical protein
MVQSMPAFQQITALAEDGDSRWSPYERVPSYNDDTYPPILVADQNQTVHAFATQYVGEDNPKVAVVYRYWSLLNQWSKPVDIFLAPERANIDGAYIDAKGIIHLIFWLSGQFSRGLYYATSPISDAGDANSWSVPKLIGESPMEPSYGAIFGNLDKRLIVLYNGNMDGNGVYFVQSEDGGLTWTSPNPIFQTSDVNGVPIYLKTFQGNSGNVHVVWHVVSEQGKDDAAYYIQFDMSSNRWKELVKIGEGSTQIDGFGTAFPIIVEKEGVLTIVYNDGIPPTDVPPALFTKTSIDSGSSWIGPVRIFPKHVGRSGEHAGGLDSSGNYHLLFVQRIPLETEGGYSAMGGVWHSVFDGTRWSSPERVTIKGSREIYEWHDVNVVVSQGNVILAVWRIDPGNRLRGVWYSYKLLNSPELPVISPDAQQDATEKTLTPLNTESQPPATITPEAIATSQKIPSTRTDDQLQTSILSSLIPVVFLVVAYLIWSQFRKSRIG